MSRYLQKMLSRIEYVFAPSLDRTSWIESVIEFPMTDNDDNILQVTNNEVI